MPCPEEGAALTLPPGSRVRQELVSNSRGRDKPFIWGLFCFQLDVGSAVFAGRVGRERGTNHTPARRQESSTVICRGTFCPCTSGQGKSRKA